MDPIIAGTKVYVLEVRGWRLKIDRFLGGYIRYRVFNR